MWGRAKFHTQECRPDADAAGDALYGAEVLGLKEVNCGEHLVGLRRISTSSFL
jgi:hypothetical protein